MLWGAEIERESLDWERDAWEKTRKKGGSAEEKAVEGGRGVKPTEAESACVRRCVSEGAGERANVCVCVSVKAKQSVAVAEAVQQQQQQLLLWTSSSSPHR